MSDLHIQRDHHLGLPQAREVARAWARKAEEKFDMECTYEEGDTQDTLTFTRAGVAGPGGGRVGCEGQTPGFSLDGVRD